MDWEFKFDWVGQAVFFILFLIGEGLYVWLEFG